MSATRSTTALHADHVLRDLLRRWAATGAETKKVPSAVLSDPGAEVTEECLHAGRYVDALAALQGLLKQDPENGALLLSKAAALAGMGRRAEGYVIARHALDTLAWTPEAGKRFAKIALACGRFDEAASHLERAANAGVVDYETALDLGDARLGQGRFGEASDCYQQALVARPRDVVSGVRLATCALAERDYRAAEALCRSVVGEHPESSIAWSTLGIALVEQMREDEAADALMRSVALEGESSGGEGSFNLAKLMSDQGRPADAIIVLEDLLSRCPHPDGHYLYSHVLLSAGRYPEGWEQYEFRWSCEPLRGKRLQVGVPCWNGQDLRGRTILLRTEQGAGDAIQFLRYAPMLKALGATVHVLCIDEVEPIAAMCAGVDGIYSGDTQPGAFDYYINAMSLPRVMKTTVDDVPAPVPYIVPDPARRARWVARLAEDRSPLKVAIVWAGSPSHFNDHNRSISLDLLLGILGDIADISLFSLQVGAARQQLESTRSRALVVDLSPSLDSYAETAAALSAMDLLISVDTSVAHLAGAMGCPVWMLVATPADSRWMTGSTTTPWYPSMRLFRQPTRAEWSAPLGSVKEALKELVRENSEASARRLAASPGPRNGPSSFAPPAGLCRVRETALGTQQYRAGDSLLAKSIEQYGEFLHGHTEILQRLIVPGAVVVQWRPGQSMHAVMAAARAGEAGQVIVFESDDFERRLVLQNVSMSQWRNIDTLEDAHAVPGTRRAATVTVDDLHLERLDVLDIGPAASGATVLSGASTTLWQRRPFVLVRCLEDDATHEIAQRLQEHGYRCYSCEVTYYRVGNFNRCSEDRTGGARCATLIGIPEELDVEPPGAWTPIV
jgi:tetratricopeptide (TPR) repeat protein